MDAAQEKKDSKEIAKIEYEANLHQAILHDQGFGKGSVNTISEMYKDKISEIAKAENLSGVIVAGIGSCNDLPSQNQPNQIKINVIKSPTLPVVESEDDILCETALV